MNSWLQLYLYACKLLDLAMALPAENLPQFQMYKWAFIGGPVVAVSPSSDNESRTTTFSDNRLSVPSPSVSRLSHSEDNLHRGPSRTPSPSPSKMSSLTRISQTSTLFEPHIVRIEKIFRRKVSFCTCCNNVCIYCNNFFTYCNNFCTCCNNFCTNIFFTLPESIS